MPCQALICGMLGWTCNVRQKLHEKSSHFSRSTSMPTDTHFDRDGLGFRVHSGGNPRANRWFLWSTPIQMPPQRGVICGRLTQDLPSRWQMFGKARPEHRGLTVGSYAVSLSGRGFSSYTKVYTVKYDSGCPLSVFSRKPRARHSPASKAWQGLLLPRRREAP